jgi:hypothetical protein
MMMISKAPGAGFIPIMVMEPFETLQWRLDFFNVRKVKIRYNGRWFRASWGDFDDNDGFVDLFLSPMMAMTFSTRNNGDGTFTGLQKPLE